MVHRSTDGSYAKTIELQKKIDDKFYYVVEAVPDAKSKSLHVVSAYINKNDTFSEVAVSKDPSRYVQDELQTNVSSNNSISQKQQNTTGNQKFSITGVKSRTVDSSLLLKAEHMLLNDLPKMVHRSTVLGENAPKSFAEFLELKYNNSEMWRFVRLDYKRRRELILHPELKLPNAENVVLPEAKFTKYLFGGDHPEGLAKGRAINSRLGFNIDNWREFSDAIKASADKYPATAKGQNQHGIRYEQKIILQGLKGKPANVVIGWIHKTNGEVSMTSAYIKEVT